MTLERISIDVTGSAIQAPEHHACHDIETIVFGVQQNGQLANSGAPRHTRLFVISRISFCDFFEITQAFVVVTLRPSSHWPERLTPYQPLPALDSRPAAILFRFAADTPPRPIPSIMRL